MPSAAALTIALLLGLLLGGCSRGAAQLGENPLADAAPVVLIVTNARNTTAWLREDGTLLTTSHSLPRGETTGPIFVSSEERSYRLLDSGDGLLETGWKRQEASPEPASLDRNKDWALVALSSKLNPDTITPPFRAVAAVTPPRVGDRLLLVGYAMEASGYVRYWTEVEVIPVPARHRDQKHHRYIWFRTITGANLKEGFSGAPLFALGEDGAQVKGMMVAATFGEDSPKNVGIAIPVPVR